MKQVSLQNLGGTIFLCIRVSYVNTSPQNFCSKENGDYSIRPDISYRVPGLTGFGFGMTGLTSLAGLSWLGMAGLDWTGRGSTAGAGDSGCVSWVLQG